MAVGAYVNGSDTQAALAEHWNGRAWKVLPAPDPGPNENALTAISCPAAQCIAVGYYDAAGDHQALAEQWNGTTWTTLTVPHDGVLTGVSCPAVNNCMAVGGYGQSQPLSATWDGSTWTVQASPAPAGLSELNAVACLSRTRCIAVGDYFSDSGQLLRPLTALWNGTAWTMLTTPAPGGPTAFNALTSVSCSGPSNCMAVGRAFHTHPLPPALAESWNGTRWTIRPTPGLKIKPIVHLDAVSCTTAARCRAVGGYLKLSGTGFVLAEAWNGADWRRLNPSPTPALRSTTCTPSPARPPATASRSAPASAPNATRNPQPPSLGLNEVPQPPPASAVREILGGVRVGIAHHLGWAVAVTASADHEVADRRRIELIEPGLPAAPVEHAAKPLCDDAAARMVAAARASALRATAASLDQLAASLPEPIVSMSLRAWPLDFPDDVAVQRRPPYQSRADSVMYCQVLSECAHVRGWEVHLFDARDVEAQAVRLLGPRADGVLCRPRATLGPPWTKDHRIALAATIVAS